GGPLLRGWLDDVPRRARPLGDLRRRRTRRERADGARADHRGPRGDDPAEVVFPRPEAFAALAREAGAARLLGASGAHSLQTSMRRLRAWRVGFGVEGGASLARDAREPLVCRASRHVARVPIV